jgi:hypothetical protein
MAGRFSEVSTELRDYCGVVLQKAIGRTMPLYPKNKEALLAACGQLPKPRARSIWRFTGTPYSGNSCPGWQRLDNNPKTEAIAQAIFFLTNATTIARSGALMVHRARGTVHVQVGSDWITT